MNITGLYEIEDDSYRYKMPEIISCIEGRGNGIKSVILNINDIAKSLYRDANEISKYLSLSLNTPMKYNKKEKRLVLNGEFTKTQLSESLKKYIQQYIICNQCSLPETHYKIKTSIRKICNACGYRQKLHLDDSNEKLNKYIIKQKDIV